MTADRWTWQEVRNLRRWYPLYPAATVARLLRRTVPSVRSRAKMLGLDSGYHQRWTPADDATLASLWAEGLTGPVIGERMGRDPVNVWRRAARLGLRRLERVALTPEVLGRIEAVVRDGRCDRCAADAVGCERHTVSHLRRRRGWPPSPSQSCPCVRDGARERMREQCEAVGVGSLAELRSLVHARRAAARGWPADLRQRHVQILDALYERGPMTRRQIADAVGMPWKGSRKSLMSNDPEGSYLAHLQARGLVVRLGRVRGPGRSYAWVYSTPLWVERGAIG